VLEAIARFALRAPRPILVVAACIMIGAGIFGVPVASTLSATGFRDPGSESSRASNILAGTFEQGSMQMTIAITSDGGVQSAASRDVATEIVDKLRSKPFVAQVSSAWTTPPPGSAPLTSKDGKTGLIAIGISGTESAVIEHAGDLSDELVHEREGVTVQGGGEAITAVEIRGQTEKDLATMEAIAIPCSFLVLIWVFGGLVAAALPVVVGMFSILGSMAVLRAITYFTDVSIFALNLCLAMGLALAIDSTLLILNRFREELADGHSREMALVRTMVTAGRTVLFSALTVALSVSTLVIFPMYFLKSFAYAGLAVVVFAASAALIIAPAAIVLLGERLDSLDIHRLFQRKRDKDGRGRHVQVTEGDQDRTAPKAGPRPIEQSPWYRIAKFAMRRSIVVAVVIITLLVGLGLPFAGVRWGNPDDRVLPASASARVVGDQLRTGFVDDLATNVTAVIPQADGINPIDLDRYSADLSRVAGVTSVSAPGGTFAGGSLVGPPSAPTAVKGGSAFLTIATSAPLYSEASNAELDGLHGVKGPGGRDVLFTGAEQMNRDIAHAVTSRLPVVLGLIATVTFILLFLLLGSVVLPLKALMLNVLSLTAAFGAMVWIFQDGHLGAFGTTATGTLVVDVPMLLFCIAFGLSMDYEVFLTSRIREFYLQSDQTREDNDESVALGVAHTARIITAAALIMSISFAALIAAHVSFMRMFGLGLTLAVLADATLVRMMLVPSFMHLMGRFNWWAPKPLARLHKRIGFSESGTPTEDATPKEDITSKGDVASEEGITLQEEDVMTQGDFTPEDVVTREEDVTPEDDVTRNETNIEEHAKR
jgi:RND superfamily putative drug exporter